MKTNLSFFAWPAFHEAAVSTGERIVCDKHHFYADNLMENVNNENQCQFR